MGVRGWLLRRAALRPRVLVAACPYGTRARLLVEAEVAARGWAFALSPAQAGVLAVCGTPGDELSEAVRVVWGELPEPRALVSAAPDASAEEVALALDGAVETLAEGGGGGFERAAYGEVAMAGRGPDRDGLKLDRLHVPLGPVLVDWPAGLVVETVLQGDVIQEAAVRAVSAGETGAAFWPPPRARVLVRAGGRRGIWTASRGCSAWRAGSGRPWRPVGCGTCCSPGVAGARWRATASGSRGGCAGRGCCAGCSEGWGRSGTGPECRGGCAVTCWIGRTGGRTRARGPSAAPRATGVRRVRRPPSRCRSYPSC
ncbi:hypothetical protein ACFQYP_05120 [Nonomuraea antimicrobica]